MAAPCSAAAVRLAAAAALQTTARSAKAGHCPLGCRPQAQGRHLVRGFVRRLQLAATRAARPARRPDAACGSASCGSRARCRAHRRWRTRSGPTTGAHLCPRQHEALTEAAFSARWCLRLSQATGSLGQSAAWTALAGHAGLGFHTAAHSCRRTCTALAA
eukprot:scaffold6208_cov64-Phaeocystis_antarctica.AAC.7